MKKRQELIHIPNIYLKNSNYVAVNFVEYQKKQLEIYISRSLIMFMTVFI